jgi:MYXO-CTERM domain-containing protein
MSATGVAGSGATGAAGAMTGAAGSTMTGAAGSMTGSGGDGVYPTGAGGGAGSHGSQSFVTGDAEYKGKVIVKDGCSCEVAPTSSGPGAFLLLGALLAFRRKRRR